MTHQLVAVGEQAGNPTRSGGCVRKEEAEGGAEVRGVISAEEVAGLRGGAG